MIIITGAARSGTSLTTAAFAACGARLGPVNSANEATAFKLDVLRPYLESIGADPLGQNPLPDLLDLTFCETLSERAREALEGVDVLKDAKCALVWPIMVAAFPDARWIICHRSPEAIAESCIRASFMTGHKTRADWSEWARTYHARCDEIREKLPARVGEPDRYIGGDFSELREAIEWAGFAFNEKAVRALVNPRRWGGA